MATHLISLKDGFKICFMVGFILRDVYHQAHSASLSERNPDIHFRALQLDSVQLPHRIKRNLCSDITCTNVEYCDPFDKYCRGCEWLCQGAGMNKRGREESKCETFCPGYYNVLRSITAPVAVTPTSGPRYLEARDTSSAGKLPQVAHIFIVVFVPLLGVVAVIVISITIWKVYSSRCRKHGENDNSENADQPPNGSAFPNDSAGQTGEVIEIPRAEANLPGPSDPQLINGATGENRTSSSGASHKNHTDEAQSLLDASNGNRAQVPARPCTSASSGYGETVVSDGETSSRIRSPVSEDASQINLWEVAGLNSTTPGGIEMKDLSGHTEHHALLRGANTFMEEPV